MTASTDEFPIGARVTLVELTKAPQYNGKTGVVKSSLNGDGRQHVFVSDLSKTMALRTSNLTYELRSADSLSVKELKTFIAAKNVEENVTGMDITDLRSVVSRHAESLEEIAEILAKASAPSSSATSSSAAPIDKNQFRNQVNAVSQMTPDQLKQQARAMRAMDPATIRRMNPQLAGMSDQQIRAAADQMELMANNPSMFQMAKQQMQGMSPDQLEEQLKKNAAAAGAGTPAASAGGTAARSSTAAMPSGNIQNQLGNLSPEQLKQQAQAMKNMDPADIKRLNPQFAGMTDEQIKAAIAQMETMASNPEMFNMMKDQIKHMSPEDLRAMQQQQGAGPSFANMNPAEMAKNMDSKQIKQMLELVKKNPALMKQAVQSNPAMAGMSEEQLDKSLEMFSQMDEKQLERAMGMVNRIQKVTQPVSSAYSKVNGMMGGHLAKILILLVIVVLSSLVWTWTSGGSGSVDSVLGAKQAPVVLESVQEQQDEFGSEF